MIGEDDNQYSRAPIAIFAYNRAQHLANMLASLRRCAGFEQSEVTVFVDGPRSPADDQKVAATKAVVVNLGLPNLRLVARDKNMGLRHSIYSGVRELCSKHGRAIVFEDDLELSPITLDYFQAALDKYADTQRVWSVSAYMYRVPSLRTCTQALVLPWAHPWGWATWDRAWSRFELDRPVPEDLLTSRTFRLFFDLAGLRDFTAILRLAKENLVNSWYIQWYRLIFEAGGVSIFPPQTLVRNTGMKEGGTHASRFNPYDLLSKPDELSREVPSLPDELVVDWRAIDAMTKSWDARLQKAIGILGRIKRRLIKS